jgi:hypothetical protein
VFRPEIDPQLTSLVIHDIQHLYLDKQVAGAEGDYDPERMGLTLTLLIDGLRIPADAAAHPLHRARRHRRLPEVDKAKT